MTKTLISSLIPTVGGIVNKGIDAVFTHHDREEEKQWWYEQQKYLEEHNSPAYRAMQMRKAGLNPYTEVSSTPLGNVDSSLPRVGSSPTFDVNAIQNSLLVQAQEENLKSQTNKNNVDAGLTESKQITETEWRSNIIQQTLNLQQEYELGLVTLSERQEKFYELKRAYDAGYNSYLIEMELSKSSRDLNQSIIALNEVRAGKEHQETLNLAVQNAAMTFQLELDRFFEPLLREAELESMSIYNKFESAKFQEFMDTQDVRISLQNVQKAFAKLAVDESARQDALARITNETEIIIAQQLLDAAKNGEGFDYYILNLVTKDPGAALQSLTNIMTAFAPNVNYNSSRSTTRVTRKNEK